MKTNYLHTDREEFEWLTLETMILLSQRE
jgi:hypothetical protein